MADFREFTGKTVEEAIANAVAELGIDKNSIQFEIVEHESKGFLGIGSKPAKIKVTVETKEASEEVTEAEKVEAVEVKTEVSSEEEAKAKEEESDDDFHAEDVDESEEASEKNSGEKNSQEDIDKAIAEAKEFISKVLGIMEITANIEAVYSEEDATINVNLVGDDMGVLIGKRGATLDSLQYLTSLVVNKGTKEYIKVKLDTEDYRKRRKDTLENLAKNLAQKAKRTGKSVSLEPMNPYERRIIHSALQSDKFVETHSEGEEPYRRVVITVKKGAMNYRRNSYGNNRGSFGKKPYGRGGNRGFGGRKPYGNNGKFEKKYSANNENSKDYSTDYKRDYEAYREQKAAERAANGDSREKLASPLYNPLLENNNTGSGDNA